MKNTRSVNTGTVKVKDVEFANGFWQSRIDLIRSVVLPYQWDALNDNIPGQEPSGALENFKIAGGLSNGEFQGMVFQDSDTAKWIEAVSYILEGKPDTQLEETVDQVIDVIGAAQQDDGYLNTYFTIKEPDNRWSNLHEGHELYCAGHMIEAGVAYYNATGKDKLLKIVCRFADLISEIFGHEPTQIPGYPGHQEIELALVRLYNVTKNVTYLNLSKYFLDQRGQDDDYFKLQWEKRGKTEYFPGLRDLGRKYLQDHLPVRKQKEPVGHAVRVGYMFAAAADVGQIYEDQELLDAVDTVWENMINQQYYITGGIGSSAHDGEAFTLPYDLPPDRPYTETCAAVGLVFWGWRMLNYSLDSKYADVLERSLYNAALPGMSLDGKKFFYVNPLSVDPRLSGKRHDMSHIKSERQSWYGCACCPPNLSRLVASIGSYFYSYNSETVYVHLYGTSSTKLEIGSGVAITQESEYPWNGNIQLTVDPDKEQIKFRLALRIPGWSDSPSLLVNNQEVDTDSRENGYVVIDRVWKKGDTVTLLLPMPPRLTYGNTALRDTAGLVAIERGPLVYCFEQADNGADLHNLSLSDKPKIIEHQYDPGLLNGIVELEVEGKRYSSKNNLLYGTQKPSSEKVILKAVPYFAWGNRGLGEMRVWLRQD